jgi:TonB family protein
MPGWRTCCAALATCAFSLASTAVAQPTPPPLNIAPVLHPGVAPPWHVRVLAYPPRPNAVTCADGPAALESGESPQAQFSVAFDNLNNPMAQIGPQPSAYDVAFAIGADGRPLSLKVVRTGQPTMPFMSPVNDPIGPLIIGTWRFSGHRAHEACHLHIEGQLVSMENATPPDIVAAMGNSLMATNDNGWQTASSPMLGAANVLIKVLLPAGGDCYKTGRPHPSVLAFPDDDAVVEPGGSRSWAILSYDVNSDGGPTNVRVAGSSGNASLDSQSLAAVTHSRFTRDARQGCITAFSHRGPSLKWPSEPPLNEVSKNCPFDPKVERVTVSPFYPQGYRQRGIDGWALVKFDVAPWGDIGNIAVARAEPADDFGQAAVNLVRSTKQTPSEHGYTDCFAPVLFISPPPE